MKYTRDYENHPGDSYVLLRSHCLDASGKERSLQTRATFAELRQLGVHEREQFIENNYLLLENKLDLSLRISP